MNQRISKVGDRIFVGTVGTVVKREYNQKVSLHEEIIRTVEEVGKIEGEERYWIETEEDDVRYCSGWFFTYEEAKNEINKIIQSHKEDKEAEIKYRMQILERLHRLSRELDSFNPDEESEKC